MEHIMKLYESSFEDVKYGKKKREYRLNDEKRKLVRVGDTIRFLKLPKMKNLLLMLKEQKLLIIGLIVILNIMMKILKIDMKMLKQQ